MVKHADTKKEISCIIANLFVSLDQPCEYCHKNEDKIIITGETFGGHKATMYIEEEGIFYLEGSEEVEAELAQIRGGRCIYDRWG